MKVKYTIEVEYKLENCMLRLDQLLHSGEHALTRQIDLESALSDSIEGYEVKSLTVSGELVE